MTDDDFESRRTIQRVIRVLRRSKADPHYQIKVIALSIGALAAAALIGIGIPWIFFRSDVAAAKPPRVVTAPVQTCPVVVAPAPKVVATRIVDLGDGSCEMLIESKIDGDVSIDGKAIGSAPVVATGLWCGRPVTVRVASFARTIITEEGRQARLMATPSRPEARPEPARRARRSPERPRDVVVTLVDPFAR